MIVIIITLVLLLIFFIGYTIFLHRTNTEYKEKNGELENEVKYFDEMKAEYKIKENNYNDRLNNITRALTNCSNALVICSKSLANFSDPCTDLRANYADYVNKFVILAGINTELNSELNEIRDNYDELQANHSLLQQEYDSVKDDNTAINLYLNNLLNIHKKIIIADFLQRIHILINKL